MSAEDLERKRQAESLYQRYGKPLEVHHRGEYVAISPDGSTVLGNTVVETLDKSLEAFGPGGFIFKLGEKAVWRWR